MVHWLSLITPGDCLFICLSEFNYWSTTTGIRMFTEEPLIFFSSPSNVVYFLSKKLLLISLSRCRTTHFLWEGGGLSEAQMLFCSHLWKSTFSIRWMKNSPTPDFFIQKVNGSAVLSDHKLCFPAALLKQNSLEKCKGNTTGDRKESQLISWRQHCTDRKSVV